MRLKLFYMFSLCCFSLFIVAQEKIADKEFKYQDVTGIGFEKGVTRRDPSDVIKVGNKHYVYYTKVYGKSSGYWGTIWCAESSDKGYTWKEKGEVLNVGKKGTFDSHAVFTPNVIYTNGKYYLYYTGVRPTPDRTDGVFENNHKNDITAIGVAVSDTPDGPFMRVNDEPVLQISSNQTAFDSYRIDDAALLYKDNKYWLYYKGRCFLDGTTGARNTKMGVAFSDSPTGPFVKYNKPLLANSHEVLIWKEVSGIYALASLSSSIEKSTDGLDFQSAALHVEKKNRPNAPGAFRIDLTDANKTENLSWGVSMVSKDKSCYLVRYSFE